MTANEVVIKALREELEPLSYINALWLEGSIANGTDDEYSDMDFWVDCDDMFEVEAINVVERALAKVSEIDFRYIVAHGHAKIRQRFYHLKGTSKYLKIDFCWQLHSRCKEEYCYIEGDTIEAVKIIFDKDNVIRYKQFNPAEYADGNKALLEDAKYRYTEHQHIHVMRYVHRNKYLEAYGYYNRDVLEPLITLLRIIYTPAHTEYSLTHISQHIPADDVKRLEYFAQISSLADIERKIIEAEVWFMELLEKAEP